jgi:lipopolysaccharide transport system permease protein
MSIHSTSSGRAKELLLRPGHADAHYWREMWDYRELFWVLAWRDIAVRYKQTVIGVAWAILRPLLTMLVFTIIFGKIARLPSDGNAPYALMVYAGMLPWYLFSASLAGAAESIVANANLVGKVYFPRMIVPAASIVTALIDFLISLAILGLLMLWYGFWPGAQILFLPLFIALALLPSVGLGLWITALNVKYRDFRYVIPFLLQFGLYVSPVGFSSRIVPEEWRLLFSLNPMVGVIDGFRWCILGEASALYLPGFALSLVVTALCLWIGIGTFRRMEKSFADLI